MEQSLSDTSMDAPRASERRRPSSSTTVESTVVLTDVEVPLPAPAVVAPPREVVPAERSEHVSRALNVTVSLVAMILLAPVFVIVAILVKLSSRGPIFYTQQRVGIDRRWARTRAIHDRRAEDLGGSVFTIYKFRSMYTDAEAGSGAVWATKRDDRVTPFGRIMRQTRLDELPQLLNVLKGDMNVVGPRPERPSIFVRLRNDIEDYPIRQRAKPGITGWAQINQPYDSCIEDVRRKVQYDIEYLQRQSAWEDVKIMAKTIPVIVFRRGAN
jgi:lipopolysaccharide/colanic/teichoic acid biosynthesis glycosyltransferase